MFNYQTSDNTVNITFSKELLSSPEIVKFIEVLRIKELLSNSQLNPENVMVLDDELKEIWWQKNKDTFLGLAGAFEQNLRFQQNPTMQNFSKAPAGNY